MFFLKLNPKKEDEKIENRLKRIQKKGDEMIEEAQRQQYEAVEFLRLEKEQMLKVALALSAKCARTEKQKHAQDLKSKQKQLNERLESMERFT